MTHPNPKIDEAIDEAHDEIRNAVEARREQPWRKFLYALVATVERETRERDCTAVRAVQERLGNDAKGFTPDEPGDPRKAHFMAAGGAYEALKAIRALIPKKEADRG